MFLRNRQGRGPPCPTRFPPPAVSALPPLVAPVVSVLFTSVTMAIPHPRPISDKEAVASCLPRSAGQGGQDHEGPRSRVVWAKNPVVGALVEELVDYFQHFSTSVGSGRLPQLCGGGQQAIKAPNVRHGKDFSDTDMFDDDSTCCLTTPLSVHGS